MKIQDDELLELKMKAFVADLLASVNAKKSVQDTIQYVVENVGIFTDSREVCVYEIAAGKDNAEKIYFWKKEHPAVEAVNIKPLQRGEIACWMDRLKQKQLVVMEDREGIRDSMPGVYANMELLEIQTLMLIPVSVQERLTACISLVNPDFAKFAVLNHMWLFLGRQVGAVSYREKMNHKYHLFMDGIRSSNLSEFVVDYNTRRYEAFRITKLLSDMIPEEGDWDWLRHFYADIIKPEYRKDVLECTEDEYMRQLLCADKSTFYIDIEREVDGKSIWFRLEFSVASLDEKGNLERFVLLVKDITEQKQREEWMQYKIEHDELTGAWNRVAFNRTTTMLDEAKRPFGFILMDIDKFKSINDTYGHDVGDEVLVKLVSVLDEKMRASDKIFRIGGDEFVVVLKHLTQNQSEWVKRVMSDVNGVLASGADGLPAFSVSAGVTFSAGGYDEAIYQNADRALYRTKETTRNGCTVFEEME